MPLELTKAIPGDFDEIMVVQFLAFEDPGEPYHEVLFPGGNTVEARAKAKDRTLDWLQVEPKATFLKVTDTDTGEIIAAGKWCMFKEPEEEGPAQADWHEGRKREHCEFVMNYIMKKRSQFIHDIGKFCFLDLLFTSPHHRGRGAGTKIMEWGLSQADEAGVPSFLESSLVAREFYEKCGYQVVEFVSTVEERWAGLPPVEYYFMERGPKTRK